MGKVTFKMILWIVTTTFILGTPLSSTVYAYGGGGGGGGGGDGAGSTFDSLDGPPPGFEGENIEPEFRTPDFVNHPKEKERDPWGLKTKPSHWSEKQWKEYKKNQNNIFIHQKDEAFAEKGKADRNLTIAKGAGYAAAGAGAVVGAVAAPAVAPTIAVISVVGDGAATTAGSLAEGKGIGDSLKDGLKKSAASAILSKVSTGKDVVDAGIGLVGGIIYDNTNSSAKEPGNQLPPPDFTTRGGHGVYK